MPLPDERPRQSVANLIGRFEKQKSSAGPPAPPPTFPRTSSVVSHRTGDSTQEEIKEKREWPPKGVDKSAVPVSPPVQTLEPPLSSVSSTSPVIKEKAPPLEQKLSTPPAGPKPSTPLSSADNTKLVQSTLSAAKSPPSNQVKSAPPHTAPSIKSPGPKPAARSSTSAALKPQASSGSVSMNSTPLKPQHTGQSTTSTGTSTRTASKPRASAPSKTHAAVTPARAKTPLSNARPKTPSSSPRPKTPSGLFAPTAASLARSKAGAPTPPPPEKPKRKITTDLSKPTAASASKMRSAAPPPAIKGVKTPAAKTAGTKTLAKSPAGKAIPAAKQPPVVESRLAKAATGQAKDAVSKKTSSGVVPIAAAAVVVAGGATVIAAETSKPSDETVPHPASDLVTLDADNVLATESEDVHPGEVDADTAEDEQHDLEESTVSHVDDEIESYDEDFPEEHGVHEEHQSMEPEEDAGALEEASLIEQSDQEQADLENSVHTHGVDILVTDEPTAHDVPEENGAESPDTLPGSHDISSDLHHAEDIVHSQAPEHAEEHSDVGTKTAPTIGTDLEDIVNLLESGPTMQRPPVEVSSSSEAGEIPDEY